MIKKDVAANYKIVLPAKGRAKKELDLLYNRRAQQFKKSIDKLTKSPTDYTIKDIEKLTNIKYGEYSIRVSKGDRLFYDVDAKSRTVFLRRAGKHDLYRLMK
jgi:mRNA-degrading endonuclease RelE of RelBE toxin-antitoxin system